MSAQSPGWRVGDAGHTVFGPQTDAPSPKVIAQNLSRVDAKLIVRSVNAAPKLAEALRDAETALKRIGEWRVNTTRDALDIAREAHKKVSVALAKWDAP